MEIIVWILGIYIIFEICFYLVLKLYILPQLQKSLTRHMQPPWFKDSKLMMIDIYSICERISTYSFEKFVTGFFLHAKFSEIYASNYDSFLSWAVFIKNLEDLSSDEYETVEYLRELAAKTFNFQWTYGYNPKVKHIKFNLEKINYIHRPLLYVGILCAMEVYTKVLYFWPGGFKRRTTRCGASYWISEKKSSNKTPIILFHGISAGWLFYVDLVKALISTNRTVILYNYDCIKWSSFSFYAPTAVEVNESVLSIMSTHGIDKISVVGHSWGGFLTGWMIRLSPEIIEKVMFIDPIALTVVLPETAFYILYKPNKVLTDYLLHFFVRTDLTIANTLHRHLFWYNSALNFDDIPKTIPVAVGIATKDELLCFDAINVLTDEGAEKRYLLTDDNPSMEGTTPITKFVWNNIGHADALLNKASITDIKNYFY